MTAGTEMLAQDPGTVIWRGDMKRQVIWNSEQKARPREPYLVSNNGTKRRGYCGQTEEKKKTASENRKALGTSLVCSLEKNNQKILKQSVQYLNHFSLWFPPCFWDANFIAIKKITLQKSTPSKMCIMYASQLIWHTHTSFRSNLVKFLTQ